MHVRLALLASIVAAVAVPFNAHAQWQLDGTPLSTAANDQSSPTIVSDGAGGAIVTWQDTRSGTSIDIYAQRLNAFGAPQWTANGVALCTATNHQYTPTIVSDGAGGAIVTWQDTRSGTNNDIYAQRVNALGAPQWTANGVALCAAASDQYYPTIVSDGAGGAIVTWHDYRSGPSADIYAQRVNASGAPQWAANGVALCTAVNDQLYPAIVSDGAGGAIVTWYEYRSGTPDIYAQRVNAAGAPQWTANGVAVCTAAHNQDTPTIASDGAGGAIVTWQDTRSGTDSDIYAQRVNAVGAPQWTANGVALCTAASEQYVPTIVSDGAGGAIVTWQDLRSGNYDVYVQRVNALGVSQWTADGVALSTAVNDQVTPTIASDGAGGATVTWFDNRSNTDYDIYAQRVNALGVPQWTANGLALSTAAYNQTTPTIVSDGAGGTIVTWNDFRSGTTYDIYAQRIERHGYWGHPEPFVTSVADVPGDQGGKVKVNYLASDRDAFDQRFITHYSVWRATDPVAAAAAIAGNPSLLVDASDIDPEFGGPAFRVEHTPNADYYWEWIGAQDAQYFAGYRFTAGTTADSTSQGTATHYFQVLSHTMDPFVFWPSNVGSGHSVDNLAPSPPFLLAAQRVGNDVHVKWNRVRVADLRDYSVYRATSSGVTPVPVNFVASSNDTVLIDAHAPTTTLYYIVTAYDVHENQSHPSNEASVQGSTGVGNTPPITALTVLDNMPNPFTATTTLRIGLPKASEVEIDVFDVAGRRVRSERLATLAAGWREVSFDARDAGGQTLPSGVYFYRVRASGTTVTHKMVIAR